MEAKHTPGPWSFVDHSWCDKSIYASLHETSERRIASLHLAEDASEDEEAVEVANARLIAAAPDLLEALREAEAALEVAIGRMMQLGDVKPRDFKTSEQLALVAVQRAIAKATGSAT